MDKYDIIFAVVAILIFIYCTGKYAKRGCSASFFYIIASFATVFLSFFLSNLAGKMLGRFFEGKTGEISPDGVAMTIAFFPIMLLLFVITNGIAKLLSKVVKPFPVFGIIDKILGGVLGAILAYYIFGIALSMFGTIKTIMNI